MGGIRGLKLKRAVVLAVMLTGASNAAAAVALFDFGANVDGTAYCADPFLCTGLTDLSSVPGVDDAGFDYSSGLGEISFSVSGAGDHNVALWLDHELSAPFNGPFNETGTVNGTPEAGQSWEIDEPGFSFGDIFFNLLDNTLDNTNAFDGGLLDDPSMAIGWDFSLIVGEIATVFFESTEVAPSGFSLGISDDETGETVFLSSRLEISSPPVDVPEPSSFGLLLLAAGGLFGRWRRQEAC